MIDATTPEGRTKLRKVAEDGWTIQSTQALALFAEIDRLEAENAELEAHAEYMGRLLPEVQRNMDGLRARAEIAAERHEEQRRIAEEAFADATTRARKAEADLSRGRILMASGAQILDNHAEMLSKLVMDTPKDQELTDRLVALTRDSAAALRKALKDEQ